MFAREIRYFQMQAFVQAPPSRARGSSASGNARFLSRGLLDRPKWQPLFAFSPPGKPLTTAEKPPTAHHPRHPSGPGRRSNLLFTTPPTTIQVFSVCTKVLDCNPSRIPTLSYYILRVHLRTVNAGMKCQVSRHLKNDWLAKS